MNLNEIRSYILSLGEVDIKRPFDEHTIVFEVNETMFALVHEGKEPPRISLRCDPELSKFLREKYEEVMTGDHLDRKNWITVVQTGQLSVDEVKDLMRHSYLLVKGFSL